MSTLSSLSCSIALLCISTIFHSTTAQNATSPLEEYVFAEDALYSWTDLKHSFEGATNHGAYRAHVINMTSGTFLNESIVDHVIWWHYIVIIIPNPIASTENAFYWTACADAGSNTHPENLPNALSDDVVIAAEIATQSNLISFVIYTNPNQPIVWADDPTQKRRSNDALLAYSLHESMFYGYPPLFFPMVRANVRALDTLQKFTAQRFNWNLQHFSAGGASKWGWLTWLFAAVDDRVVSFVPVVFDMLNWNQNAHHQYKSYGGWTWAFEDYWQQGLTAYLDTAMEQDLFNIIDPYMFRADYEGKPKIVVHNGRDEFFMPDDTWYWWDDMTLPKWTLLVPNTEHAGVTGLGETLPAISTWIYATLMLDVDKVIPKVNWTLNHETFSINAQTNMLPISAKVWYTESCRECNQRRDFRALNLDSPCASNVVLDGDKCYNLNSVWLYDNISYVDVNNEGWYEWEYTITGKAKLGGAYRVFFMDFKFNVTDGFEEEEVGWPFDNYGIFELSTECMVQNVTNNTFPFPDCSGYSCNGTLV